MAVNKRLIGGAAAAGPLTPSENFKVVTWTGDGVDDREIEVGFQPDFVWFKTRSAANDHNASDSNRGATKQSRPNRTIAEVSATDLIKSFTSTGFTVGTGGDANGSGNTYVAWCWKANGGTTSSNSDGSITTTVQTNTAAGFSIITYSGNGTVGATIGHNLGYVPNWFAVKKRSSGTTNWRVYHTYTDDTNPQNYNVEFNGDGAKDDRTEWNDTMPTSSVISLNAHDSVNESGSDYVCYAWADIDAFSKFGKYTGNGSTNGPIVETGFEPAFLMIKRTDSTGNWVMLDNKRQTTNPRNKLIWANKSDAETDFSPDTRAVNFYSNGFQPVSDGSDDINDNNATYIYMAFAADPDEETPTLASSFNIETYTGTGSSQAITGLGFEPNFVWLKSRSNGGITHTLFDTLRGAGNELVSAANSAQSYGSNRLTSFDTDGFSLGDSGGQNMNNETFVAWSWKADDNEPTLRGGNAKAVYKFEDNYNDVTGTYNGSGTSGTSFISGGKFNKAVAFSGTSSNMDTGITARNFESWSFWFKPGSSNTGYRVIVCTNTSGDVGQNLEYNSSNSLYIADILGGATNTSASVTIDLRDGDWHHIVITKTATKVRVYVDKVEKLSIDNATGSSLQSGNEWSFGKGNYGDANSDFNIDQARYYEGVLEQEDIDKLYNETAADNDDLSFGAPKEIITSTNANAGFSIVKYEGDGQANNKIPHGLSSSPEFVIIKNLGDAEDWQVFGNTMFDRMQLNSSGSDDGNYPLSYSATTLTLPQGGQEANNAWNANGDNYIMYCFHSVSGYSKFGTYTGNGSSTGPSVTTGFKPDFIMIKRTDATEDWKLIDSLRGFANSLEPNEAIAEEAGNNSNFTFSSTGFQIGDTHGDYNASGGTYIYWAIAKNVPSNTTLASSFNAAFYAGSGSSREVNNFEFRPDLVWIKRLSSSASHSWTDAVRGDDLVLQSNETSAEATGQINLIADGIKIRNDNALRNTYRDSYIAWGFKAGTTWESNVDGTIPSIVNTNTANGFSIVKYVGNGVNSATVGHNLGGTPEMIIHRRIDGASGWIVNHKDLDNGKEIYLQRSDAQTDSMGNDGGMPNGTQSSTTLSFQAGASTTNNVNTDGAEYIAYCFRGISGFSKFGTYAGTGSSNSITGLGFAPDLLVIKEIDGTDSWEMYDSLRGADKVVYPNGNNAQVTGSTLTSFDSDGFTVSSATSINESGKNYIYWAVAKNATNNTTKENSFAVKTYTGNGSTQEITSIGFKPDLLWIKEASGTNPHNIWDTTRGAGKLLKPNSSDAEINNVGDLVGYFLDDGFQVNRNHGVHTAYDNTNYSGSTYVAWAWKAGNGWQSNYDGAISSLTNANTGNKFSVVRYKGTGSATTVGHDLGVAPTFMIVKTVESSAKWRVYHSTMGGTKAMNLNDAFSPGTSANYWNDTAPTTSVFSVGQDLSVNGEDHIAYVWSDCDDYSKFSTYTGTGSSQTITTGFKPDWILTKDITLSSDNWRLYDTARGLDKVLYPALTQAEDTNSTGITAVTSTGFTLGTGNLSNRSGSDYIYIAFKMN